MLVSLQIGYSFVRVTVAVAILERISGFEPSSETTAPRCVKLVTVPSFCPFTLISLWICHIGAVCHQIGLHSIDLHLIPCAIFSTLSAWASTSCSSSATAYMSSANHFDNISATYVNLSIMVFQSIRIRYDLFETNIEEDG